MTSERSNAYRLVMHTLRELGPSKLLHEEQDRIREAADTLIFSPDSGGEQDVCEAVTDIDSLCRSLVQSGRWEHVTARRLADNVAACGPARVAMPQAA